MYDDNVIQGLWIGASLPMMQRLSVSSFLANGHAYDLYVYDDVSGVPLGVRLRDAGEIMPASEVFRNGSHDTFATFSDIFRYRLLFERGGWWSDTDVICLRPFKFLDDYVFSSEHRILNGVIKEVATITIMKAPQASALLEQLYDSSVKRGKDNLEWNEIGSDLLGILLRRHSLNRAVQRAVTFCPIPMGGYERIIDPSVRFVFEAATHAAHLWHECWRRKMLDVNASFPPECLYEQLKSSLIDGTPANCQQAFILENDKQNSEST